MSQDMTIAAKLIAQTLVWYALMGLFLFVAAGTAAWPAAWVFLGQMILLSLVGGLWLARRDPALIAERLKAPVQQGQPVADKILTVVLILSFLGGFLLIALDAVRFAWSSVPLWAQAFGELLLLLSLWIGFGTLSENSFAAPVVKIQGDRGHKVVSTGLYRHVRHPLYVGAVTFIAGASLLLGSWWGLSATLVVAVLLALRIQIEEKALRAGLQGYDAYAARVRYRLIPGVW